MRAGAATRFIPEHKAQRPNPIVTGDIKDDFWLGFGVILTGAVNDNYVNPISQQLLGTFAQGLVGSDMGMKVWDGLTTWGTAEVEKYGADLLGFHAQGGPVRKGGRALAVAKFASILLPGYSLNGKLGFVQLPALAPGATATTVGPTGLLPSGQPAPAGTTTATPGAGATPPPRPAVAGLTAASRPMGI